MARLIGPAALHRHRCPRRLERCHARQGRVTAKSRGPRDERRETRRRRADPRPMVPTAARQHRRRYGRHQQSTRRGLHDLSRAKTDPDLEYSQRQASVPRRHPVLPDADTAAPALHQEDERSRRGHLRPGLYSSRR